jgi:uncharacterized membrane protein YccF (DUF307 family)
MNLIIAGIVVLLSFSVYVHGATTLTLYLVPVSFTPSTALSTSTSISAELVSNTNLTDDNCYVSTSSAVILSSGSSTNFTAWANNNGDLNYLNASDLTAYGDYCQFYSGSTESLTSQDPTITSGMLAVISYTKQDSSSVLEYFALSSGISKLSCLKSTTVCTQSFSVKSQAKSNTLTLKAIVVPGASNTSGIAAGVVLGILYSGAIFGLIWMEFFIRNNELDKRPTSLRFRNFGANVAFGVFGLGIPLFFIYATFGILFWPFGDIMIRNSIYFLIPFGRQLRSFKKEEADILNSRHICKPSYENECRDVLYFSLFSWWFIILEFAIGFVLSLSILGMELGKMHFKMVQMPRHNWKTSFDFPRQNDKGDDKPGPGKPQDRAPNVVGEIEVHTGNESEQTGIAPEAVEGEAAHHDVEKPSMPDEGQVGEELPPAQQ